MKKTVLTVRETVTNIYNFEINSEDYNEDLIDTLGDMLEDEYRNFAEAQDSGFIINNFMEDVLGMAEGEFSISCCVDEGNYVETEIDDLFVVGN